MPQSALINGRASCQTIWRVREYDLNSTFTSGQAFRWRSRDGWWHGVIGARWVRLQLADGRIVAETTSPQENWGWLADYLQVHQDLAHVFATFPADEPMQSAVSACRGLRLLRQDPWECLASFILSSTKQIIQIQQIVELLCQRFGEQVPGSWEHAPIHAFPGPARIALCSEGELRECKMGFRAPNLRAAARMLVDGEVNLDKIAAMRVDDARIELMKLPGVGQKIANCVLLFAFGFPTAFPVDVWVMKALRQLYFPRRRPSLKRLQQFTATHFGAYAGYAQQYLFHYMRTKTVQSSKSHQKPQESATINHHSSTINH